MNAPISFNDPPFDIHEITSAIVQSNEEAFNIFYRAYFGRLYQYLLSITHGDEDTVRDVIQEAMIRIIRYMKPFREEHIFWNWLVRVVRTTFIDYLRKHKKEKAIIELDEKDFALGSQNHDEVDFCHVLDTILLELHEEERIIICGHYLEGKDYGTLAQQLETTAKAIESKIARIRNKLRKLFLERLSHEEERY